MSEMVERVARASFACWRARCDDNLTHLGRGRAFEDMSGSEREFAMEHACAVIRAMREPTPEMCKPIVMTYVGVLPGDTMKTAWKAMIDEALR